MEGAWPAHSVASSFLSATCSCTAHAVALQRLYALISNKRRSYSLLMETSLGLTAAIVLVGLLLGKAAGTL